MKNKIKKRFMALIMATIIAGGVVASTDKANQYAVQMQCQSVSFKDAVKMSDAELKNKKEIVIKLKDTYNIAEKPDTLKNLNRVMTTAQDATLVVDCGEATEIKDNALKFGNSYSNETLKKVRVIAPNVTKIGRYFLFFCSSLTSVDLSGLSKVTQIGDNFLCGCTSLTSVDLSGLSKVTKIGSYFLFGCRSLRSIDLRPLSNVTKIGDFFLFGCESLTSVDLKPLSNVTKIERGFLWRCYGLTSVDLSGLSNVTQIGDLFLIHCESLTNVDLSPLSNVTQIGYGFLSGCSSLTSVDIRPLSKVTQIGGEFLYSCIRLTSVTIPKGWCFKDKVERSVSRNVHIFEATSTR